MTGSQRNICSNKKEQLTYKEARFPMYFPPQVGNTIKDDVYTKNLGTDPEHPPNLKNTYNENIDE